MVERSKTFNPAIRDTIENISVGDTVNLWADDARYTPGTVVGIIEKENGRIVAIGKEKASWPGLLCETISKDIKIAVHTPVPRNNELHNLEYRGCVKEIQVTHRGIGDETFPSTEIVQKWNNEDRLSF